MLMYTMCIGTRHVYAFNVEAFNFQTYSFMRAVVFVVSIAHNNIIIYIFEHLDLTDCIILYNTPTYSIYNIDNHDLKLNLHETNAR